MNLWWSELGDTIWDRVRPTRIIRENGIGWTLFWAEAVCTQKFKLQNFTWFYTLTFSMLLRHMLADWHSAICLAVCIHAGF